VLHKHFEWDDEKAAHQFRIEQARCLISVIHVEDDASKAGHTRAFISVKDDEAGICYRPLKEVRESLDLQVAVLKQAERDLESWTKRYADLAEVVAIVKKAQTAVAALRRKRAA
jgi:hypothetical protein